MPLSQSGKLQISYKDASSMLFINSERKDTHTFLGCIGAFWETKELRKLMRKSELFFMPEHIFGGHRIAMVTAEGKVYRLETSSKKVEKWETNHAQPERT